MTDVECFLQEVEEQVSDKMTELISKLCSGCQVNHPSQRQHDLCLMASDTERLTTTFWAAWSHMNTEQLHDCLGDLIFSRLLQKGKFIYSKFFIFQIV